jgi:hypothetical protein
MEELPVSFQVALGAVNPEPQSSFQRERFFFIYVKFYGEIIPESRAQESVHSISWE